MRRRLRIAFLASTLADHSVELAAALARRADVLLLIDREELQRDSPPPEAAAFARAGRLVRFRQRRLYRLSACAVTLVNILRFRPDVLVGHEHPKLHVAWVQRVAARLCKILLIVHDPLPHMGREAAQARRYRRALSTGRRLASAFLLHGDYCAATFKRTANPGDRLVLTAPLGPNLRPSGDAIPAPEPGRILMFGRMEAYKGLDLLLEAARILKARGVRFHLRLAGAGPALEPLREGFMALGCCSIRSEFLPREAARDEFQRASLVVLPYVEATQSGVTAIAFAFGRPVVATAVGGLPDFVCDGKNGLLTPPGDAAALAEALRRASEPALAASLSAGARETAATVMNWDQVADVIVRGAELLSPPDRRPR